MTKCSLCLAHFGYLGRRKGPSKPRTGKPRCGLFIGPPSGVDPTWITHAQHPWSLENNGWPKKGPNKQNLWSTEIVCQFRLLSTSSGANRTWRSTCWTFGNKQCNTKKNIPDYWGYISNITRTASWIQKIQQSSEVSQHFVGFALL